MNNWKFLFRKYIYCKHKFRYFNNWCQECSEFTNVKTHGVKVYHCYYCNRYYDNENGFWHKLDIENVFFIIFSEMDENDILKRNEMIIK
jgi:hypothetical protein